MNNDKNIKKPARPFSMECAEAKAKMIFSINEAAQIHHIPLFLLDEIVSNISRQITTLANNEREKELKAFEAQMEEYRKQTEGEAK